MANFDETLVEYWETREQLRKLQGELHKKKNEAKALNKEIEGLVKKYNNCRTRLVDAQGRLVPVLNAEVASHPILEREEAVEVKRPGERLSKPETLKASAAESTGALVSAKTLATVETNADGTPS